MNEKQPKVERKPLWWYLNRIRKGETFSLSRWGDGEWAAVLDIKEKHKCNCDGHRFFPAMGKQLRQALLSAGPEPHDYILAFQRFSMKVYPKKIWRWLREHGKENVVWHDADVFHRASIHGKMSRVFAALREANVVVVGPAHLRRLDRHFEYNEFVSVPPRDCYRAIDVIETAIIQAVYKVPKPVVVSISASMPAEILIHRLHHKIRGQGFLIDFGSVFDPYVGKNSRKYHHGLAAVGA